MSSFKELGPFFLFAVAEKITSKACLWSSIVRPKRGGGSCFPSAVYWSPLVSCLLVTTGQLSTGHHWSAVYWSPLVSCLLVTTGQLSTGHHWSAVYWSPLVSCQRNPPWTRYLNRYAFVKKPFQMKIQNLKYKIVRYSVRNMLIAPATFFTPLFNKSVYTRQIKEDLQ